ncbi:MAG TPA: hypothetical protein VIM81_12730 [Gammaproteobacteria bacterium]|jgi:hypothetical protein
MDICHAHNLNLTPATTKRYGIRVSLPPRDTFTRLIGSDWERFHWYATAEERDRALRDMASEHLYSRRGDRPSPRFEPVDRPAGA